MCLAINVNFFRDPSYTGNPGSSNNSQKSLSGGAIAGIVVCFSALSFPLPIWLQRTDFNIDWFIVVSHHPYIFLAKEATAMDEFLMRWCKACTP